MRCPTLFFMLVLSCASLKPTSTPTEPASHQSEASAFSKDAAKSAAKSLYEELSQSAKKERESEFSSRSISLEGRSMPFWYKTFGTKPAGGHSLYISLHGGGGAPPEVNDSQWENQKTLYSPKEGIYLCPRAPGDTWDLWHQGHIDPLFARLIEDMILFEGVDPNRVYLMGYSAGGDGVYQVAPRMADYLAAASMMAGHPNEASPVGLRNLPFAIHMGELDSSYNRNKVAREWGDKLDALQEKDPKGYTHVTQIHTGLGHWMNLQDAVAVEWMAKFTRDTWPDKIVWYQDDVLHSRFYWLSVTDPKQGEEIRAAVEGQTITIEAPPKKEVTLLLSDELLSLDQPIRVMSKGKEIFSGRVSRDASNIAESLAVRMDLTSVYTAKLALIID
jgi:hypothetical protein